MRRSRAEHGPRAKRCRTRAVDSKRVATQLRTREIRRKERRAVATSHGVTVRTLWNWEHRDPTATLPKWGRKPHSPQAHRDAYHAVRIVMKAQGKTIGEGAALRALQGAVPTLLVRWALKVRKAWLRRRDAHRCAAQRMSIVPVAPGVLGSLDAMQLGRVEHEPVKAEQVVDVLSTKTLAAEIVWSPSGADVVRMLERLRDSDEGLPLAFLLDRGPENKNREVARFAEEHHVVLIYNAPRTPEHNAPVERKNRDVRGVSGLRASTSLASLDEARCRFAAATRVLDHARLRAKHGYATAAVRDRIGRVRYTPALREALWRDVKAAQERARSDCARARDRPRAEREAALAVLDVYGMIERYRGGVRVRSA